MMRSRRPTPPQGGFTLVEMTVAVGLVALMASVLYGALTVSLRAQNQSERVAERFQTARAALQRMERELGAAYLSKHRGEEKRTKTYFKGSSDALDFTYLGHLRMVAGSRESDQGVIGYAIESDPDLPGTKALFRREKVIIDENPEKGGRVEKMAENVKSISFEYYEPEEEEWRDDWDAEPDDFEVDATGTTEGQIMQAVEDLSGITEQQEFILPARVRIHLVLKDEEDNEYEFETQAECALRHPFSW